MPNLYQVQYQVHLPAPASASTADVYRRDPQEAMPGSF